LRWRRALTAASKRRLPVVVLRDKEGDMVGNKDRASGGILDQILYSVKADHGEAVLLLRNSDGPFIITSP
jgi:hypothetical protein